MHQKLHVGTDVGTESLSRVKARWLRAGPPSKMSSRHQLHRARAVAYIRASGQSAAAVLSLGPGRTAAMENMHFYHCSCHCDADARRRRSLDRPLLRALFPQADARTLDAGGRRLSAFAGRAREHGRNPMESVMDRGSGALFSPSIPSLWVTSYCALLRHGWQGVELRRTHK
jgi:hypothetical protein